MPQNASRLPGHHFLQIPGPTPVPDRVLRAIDMPLIDQRGPEFAKLTRRVLEGIKTIFKTTQPVIIYTATGTGAWEAALTNTLSPGDRVLMVETGQFATLWKVMAERLGLKPEFIKTDWRVGADPKIVEEHLRQDKAHEIKAVCVLHNETATGCLSPIDEIRKAIDAAGHPALFLVDTISSLASTDYRHDEWGVDVTIGGAQKGLMLPAGLGFVCASPRALSAYKSAQLKRVYFDFGDMIKANATGYFPYTPALPMLYGLRESLKILFEEKLEHVFERHNVLASGVRAAVKAWGLHPCAKEPKWYSDTVTAIVVPPGFNGADVIDAAFRRYDLSLGAGLSQVAGKVFRIGHLGDLNDLMVLGAIAGAEMAMRDVGIDIKLGSGVAAAQEHFRSTIMAKEKKPSDQEHFAQLHPEGVLND